MWISDAEQYEKLRRRIKDNDPAVMRTAKILRTKADELLKEPCTSVTDKQPHPLSPSTDPRDYVSVATYSWPDPEKPDGLPYISRDGEISPDAGKFDRFRWDAAAGAMLTLIKAGYFLGNKVYAEKAAERIRHWFLSEETGMYPHLEYSQFWPGVNTGRGFGIIEFSLYVPVLLDHIVLLMRLPDSPWTDADMHAMKAWCEAFYTWLLSSEHGTEECEARNNHGVFYDRLMLSLALFLGKDEEVGPIFERVKERVASQIEPDGSMPHELRRTCSFGYSLMAARGFVELAVTAGRIGHDLWSYTTEEDRSIRRAADFLYDFARSDEEWGYTQIEPVDCRMLWPFLHAANRLSGGAYDTSAVAHRMPADADEPPFVLIEPLHMFGSCRTEEGRITA